MRWLVSKFALFAAIAAATATWFGVPAPARAVTVTSTQMSWRQQSAGQFSPSGPTTFYVRVAAAGGSDRPTGTVSVVQDGGPAVEHGLTKDDPANSKARLTDDFVIDLRDSQGHDRPHYFVVTYQGNDTFGASRDDMGIALGGLNVSPEPSKEGEVATYTFGMEITGSRVGGQRNPSGRVYFTDDQGHATDPPYAQLKGIDATHLQATWQVAERPYRPHVTAIYITGDDDPYLPVKAERDHNVIAAPPPTNGSGGTTGTTQRPSSGTTRATVPRNTGGTAALAPINQSSGSSSSTTIAAATNDSAITGETFGEFPTIPPTSGNATALADTKKRDGPPLAVVVLTLGALGVLGGVGAVRRYRRPSDWF